MVSLPDFENYGQLTNLMKVVEEKNLLMSAMEDVMKKEGISVQIGTEHSRPELHGISLVSSTYKLGDRTLGVLGILGPRRMEYGRMMSLVDGVSRVMNQLLDRINKEYSADE
jgi:heat-inducible transcriptional repressor